MQVSVKKELAFEYAHRLLDYNGKCSNIHGHNQKVWVYFERVLNQHSAPSEVVNDLGMVIDFNDIKSGIGKWIDDNWDHALILHMADKENIDRFSDGKNKMFLMPYNPTAENMARYLLDVVGPALYDAPFNRPAEGEAYGVQLYKVEVFENDKSAAVAKL